MNFLHTLATGFLELGGMLVGVPLATAALFWVAFGWSAGFIAIAWGWPVLGGAILAAWILTMAWCLGAERLHQ